MAAGYTGNGDLENLPLDQIQVFFFVLVRVAAIIFTIPFLDTRSIPILVKIGLASAISILVMPQLSLTLPPGIDNPLLFVMGLAGEVAVGAVIGLPFQLIITGVQLAGEIAGFQMGIAIANVMMNFEFLQIPALSQFLNLFALMIFLAMNAHFYFLKGLGRCIQPDSTAGSEFSTGPV